MPNVGDEMIRNNRRFKYQPFHTGVLNVSRCKPSAEVKKEAFVWLVGDGIDRHYYSFETNIVAAKVQRQGFVVNMWVEEVKLIEKPWDSCFLIDSDDSVSLITETEFHKIVEGQSDADLENYSIVRNGERWLPPENGSGRRWERVPISASQIVF